MKKVTRFIKMLVVTSIFVTGMVCIVGTGDSGGGGGDGGCERVTALAEGYGDIEIHNDLENGLEAFFPELAFGALIRPDKCEIYGVPDGFRDLELTQCNFASDDECTPFGDMQDLTIEVETGGKEVIFASDYF